MKLKISESVLVNAVARFFGSEGHVYYEVPVFGKSADLVIQSNDDLIFIEAKVDAVSRALNQCVPHELVADFVCIAIGTSKVSDNNLLKIKEKGYGLISYVPDTDECLWLLQPRRNVPGWLPARKKVMQNLELEKLCQLNIG